LAVSLAFIDPAVPAIELDSVTLLELVIEVLKELIDRRRGLVGQFREDERIGLVGHVSELPRPDAERSRSAC